MIKKFIIGDIIAAILIAAEVIILNLFIEKIGTVAYILLDVLLITVTLFVTNFIVNKKGNTKSSIINAVVLIIIYMVISGGYEKTSYGIKANEKLNEVSESEEQTLNEDSSIEVNFYEADASSKLMNYGFYLAVAFIGGKVGTKSKKKTDDE